jgi:SET domain-containing protein
MGIGSIINHSARPNCFWEADVKNKTNPTISFKTFKKVKAGEELLHDYLWGEYPEGFDY